MTCPFCGAVGTIVAVVVERKVYELVGVERDQDGDYEWETGWEIDRYWKVMADTEFMCTRCESMMDVSEIKFGDANE